MMKRGKKRVLNDFLYKKKQVKTSLTMVVSDDKKF